MRIRGKIAILVGIPLAGLLVASVLGTLALSRARDHLHDLAENQMQSLLQKEIGPLFDKEVLPLIDQRMVPLLQRQVALIDQLLPLVEIDMARLLDLQLRIGLLMEARSDALQARIVEKNALAATDDELAELVKEHNEALLKTEKRLEAACAGMEEAAGAKLAARLPAAIKDWKEKTQAVLARLSKNDDTERRFAIKSSNGGSAEESFAVLDQLIGDLTVKQRQQVAVAQEQAERRKRTAVEGRRNIESEKGSIDDTRSKLTARYQNIASQAGRVQKNALAQIERSDQLTFGFGLLGVLTTVFALCVAMILGKRIIQPLQQGVGFASAVNRGDLATRLAIKGDDEIAQLAKALDSMVDSLAAKASLADRIASGDLAAQITLASADDRLGRALIAMVESLTRLIAQAREISLQVAGGTEELTTATANLSKGATAQATAFEEISRSISELSERTRRNAGNAQEADRLAKAAAASAGIGNAKVGELLTAVEEIERSSGQIARIIEVMRDIAFQTNLLALNAAVQASHAGVHGRSFAVVAEEVRALAGRSATAAKETGELIAAAHATVAHGRELAGVAAVSLKEIVAGAGQVGSLVGAIAEASVEQAAALEQVTTTVRDADRVTQSNAANANEITAVVNELAGRASELSSSLSRFQLSTGNHARAATPPSAAKGT